MGPFKNWTSHSPLGYDFRWSRSLHFHPLQNFLLLHCFCSCWTVVLLPLYCAFHFLLLFCCCLQILAAGHEKHLRLSNTRCPPISLLEQLEQNRRSSETTWPQIPTGKDLLDPDIGHYSQVARSCFVFPFPLCLSIMFLPALPDGRQRGLSIIILLIY